MRFAARAAGTRLFAAVALVALSACASNVKTPITAASTDVDRKDSSAVASDESHDEPGATDRAGPSIGAAGASDFVMAGVSDTSLGVWVDVPKSFSKVHTPAAVALLIDTSGSMGGAKMDNAKAAAKELVSKLVDGDILTIDTFSDDAKERVAPVKLSASTRPEILRIIANLTPNGGTNMFDGLRLAEGRVLSAPASHPIRRVILISDGQANVGPSSPDVLGSLAQRGAASGVQVSSIGVGLDYDENTLNALAVNSSGRLYHLTDPKEMSAMLDGELQLLQQTAATNSFVEIAPAAGVQILGVDGARAEATDKGGVRVPLGTMFGGQHREMLVRVRVNADADGNHPLASVRFHYSDPTEAMLDRMQEVIARYEVTNDRSIVAEHINAKAQTIVAIQEAAKATIAAAQKVSSGNVAAADADLALQENHLRDVAKKLKAGKEQQRALDAAGEIASARGMAHASPPAPAAKAMNASGMHAAGF